MKDRFDDKGLVHDQERLKELQALPLNQKIGKTIARLTEFINHFGEDGVFVAVSGGKDSTVLWDITHKLFPNVPAVFSDTGLEYPEVREFARNIATEVVRPKLNFVEVIRQYGYPIISKEVSEAIYYARRNRTSQSVNVERERESKQTDLLETSGASWNPTANVSKGILGHDEDRRLLRCSTPPADRQRNTVETLGIDRSTSHDEQKRILLTPPMYGKTTPRKRSELLGQRRDPCKAGEHEESAAYG